MDVQAIGHLAGHAKHPRANGREVDRHVGGGDGTAGPHTQVADGEVVADGETAAVVVASPMFAPQIAKILAPYPWLTVSDVVNSIGPVILRSHAPTSGEAFT